MANTTVVSRPGQVKSDTVAVTFDAVVDEQHTFTNQVTDHPVEKGANISDHDRPDPDKVSFHAFFSNTPLSTTQTTKAVRSGGFTFQTTALQAAGAIGAVDGYARSQWDKLKQMRDDGTLVTVVSTLGNYDSMVIESITVPRNAKTYDGLECTIGFKKIVVVSNALTRTVTRSPQASKKKSAGNQTPKDAAEKDVDPLRKVVGGIQSANKTLSGLGGL